MPARLKTDRDLQDDLIRYLSDARLRKRGAPELPLAAAQAAKAEKFARFLARRYYRDRLVRSFRYSRLFASQIGRTAEQVVDSEVFQSYLNECVLGSLEAAQRVGEMAVAYLTVPNSPGRWWDELLEYERSFFLQAATAEQGPATPNPRVGFSTLYRRFDWNLPEMLPRLKAGEPITGDLKTSVVLLFSRTSAGRIYVVEADSTTELVLVSTDGRRNLEEIASAASLPIETVQNTLQALSEIGAVVMPPI